MADSILVLLLVSLLISILLVLVLHISNKKWPFGWYDFITKILWTVIIICFLGILLNLFVRAFLFTIVFVYKAVIALASVYISNLMICSYLSVVLTLVVVAYAPEKVGYYLLRILDKTTKPSFNLSALYVGFIRFIRSRLWIYFFAFLCMGLYSIESFSEASLKIPIWMEVSTIILPSVITFIALDRFLRLFLDEWVGLRNDIIRYYSFLTSSVDNKTNQFF